MIIKLEDLAITTRDVIVEKNNKRFYVDPKDLRGIPLERLKFEGNKFGLQNTEWNNLFDIQSAVRVNNSKKELQGYEKVSELEMWCILSNRFLLIDRKNTIKDQKIFTQYEVIQKIQDAYLQGYMDGEDKESGRKSSEYVSKINDSL